MKKSYILSIFGLFLLVFSLNLLSAGTCRDDRGRYYYCEKQYYDYEVYNYNYNYYSKIYYVQPSYQYKDNYGNTVSVQRNSGVYEVNYVNNNIARGQDYYNCYHYNSRDSRYGMLLRNQNYNCNDPYTDYGYMTDYSTPINVNVKTKPLVIYVR
jgi:hypothetical protein